MSYVDKEYNKEYARKWYANNKHRLNSNVERKERNRISASKWRKEHREASMLLAAKARAKRNELEFNLTIDDIVIPEQCPILLIPLAFTDGKQTDNTPALDRIDNTKGYLKGNVQVISHKANRHKANLSFQDIERLFNYTKDLKKLA